jgi:hypothetical protein
MAKKQLNDLAKIGLGLAAAYGASKVLGKSAEERGLEIARGETRDLTSDESIAPRRAMERTADEAQAEGLRITRAKPFEMSDDASAAKSSNYNSNTRMYGEPGSLEGFRASEAARKARIAGVAGEMSPDSPKAKLAARVNRPMLGAKKGKMMKASTGGSVVARGNKLARSKPTKLF